MKTLKLTVLSALSLLSVHEANAMVWWPEIAPISGKLTVYKDYEDSTQYYYVPKALVVANNSHGDQMVTHALFFNRLNPSKSSTQYNVTFDPILDDEDVKAAEAELKNKFGASARLSPLPITTASFEVTQKLTSNEADALQISAPMSVLVPHWTGNLHSFHQRFSAIVLGNAYSAEPALSRLMTSAGGNAVLGTMHFGFRGVRVPFQASVKIHVHQFVSKLKASLSARYSFWASADVATAIDKFKNDYEGGISVTREEGFDSAMENQMWKAITDRVIAILFEPAPEAPNPPPGEDGGFAFVKIKASYASADKDTTININLKEALVSDYRGDVEFQGGAMKAALLDKNIKYLCDMWQRFDSTKDACKDVCEPAVEFWNPTTKACVAAFGGPAN